MPGTATIDHAPELRGQLTELSASLADLDPAEVSSGDVGTLIVALEQVRASLDGAAVALLSRCDAEALHESDGLVSTRSWLKHRGHVANDTAARRIKLARDLRSAPQLSEALRHGRITADAARIVCTGLRPSTVEAFADAETMFVEWAETLHVDDLARAVRRWVELVDADGSDPEAGWKDRSVWLHQTLGGTWSLRGRLTAEGGARLSAALEQIAATTPAASDHGTDPSVSPAQRRADALVALAGAGGAGGAGGADGADANGAGGAPGVRRAGPRRDSLCVLVDADDLRLGLGARTSSGAWLDGAAVARLACDASVTFAFRDARGNLLRLYSTERRPDAHLRSAVIATHPTCIVAGCDVPSGHCDIHHLLEWYLGGETVPENLVPLCAHHHTMCHDQHWTITVTGPGSATVRRPGKPPLDATFRWSTQGGPTTLSRAGP